MPYVEGEEITVHECEGYTVKYIEWNRVGQCVAFTPTQIWKLYLHTGSNRGTIITISEGRNWAKCRQMAIDMGDLFS